jgi:hypothetical protein
MTVSTDRSRSRAFEVSSRNSDSGVVIRMSAGARWNRVRSPAGVSPVRTAMTGAWKAAPVDCATLAIPASGARRLRSTSTARALSGETYTTRQRSDASGNSSNIRRLSDHRNAASVLPLPVGARIRVDSPREIDGQPLRCGAVGEEKADSNHVATAGWNNERMPDAACRMPSAGCRMPDVVSDIPMILLVFRRRII